MKGPLKKVVRRVVLAMSLLELIVSLSLAAGLLSAIFYWIWAQNKLSKELSVIREKIYLQERIELELEQTLGRACLKPRVDPNDLSSGFKLLDKELHFYFKSSVHICPEKNLIQKAMLALEGETLILKTMPCPEFSSEQEQSHFEETQTLAKGLENLDFHFLYLAPVGPKKVVQSSSETIDKEKPLMGLLKEAHPSREDLPVAVVVCITMKNEPLHFAIWREDGALIHQVERSSL